ncbi:cyclic peptide export ABC transporter [Enterocloster clostridioformis]
MREQLRIDKAAGLLLAIPIMIFYGYGIFYLPNILLERLPWRTVIIWGSKSIMLGSIAVFLAGIIFFTYVIVTYQYPKKNEKNFFALIPLSILNGLASALIIFTINESFNRDLEYSKELLVYFVFSLMFFIYTLKQVQGKLINLTADMMYERRLSIITKIVNSSYQTIESIGFERIYSGLNNDISAISKIPGIIVNFVSNILTVIFCAAYLLSNSFVAFTASISVIVLSLSVSILTSRIASEYWEKNRDIQDIYFGQMHDLVYGFKELALSNLKKLNLWTDMEDYSKKSRDLSKEADIKFLHFHIYNRLMFNIIFGMVVFIFPLFITGIQTNSLRETLFMVFYLIGPFNTMMDFVPSITQVRVNLKRIHQLEIDLDKASSMESKRLLTPKLIKQQVSIVFKEVVYSYKVKNEETNENEIEFTLGPIDLEIRTGEVLYITGGNGSGKSTLGRLLCGLYAPQGGTVKINGGSCNIMDLNEYFAAVFSDFHLFKKLYGVDLITERCTVNELLKIMMLDKKVKINESGELHAQKLSTGQKKRLAYILCYLDDKPFMLFDEWAAEQDPEFRHYFYTQLLPALKRKGKGVIIITHDDRYFDLADRLIKLERGEIVINE